MRRTKIICTIGPSSEDSSTLKKLAKAGMNVARINLSHGDAKYRNTLLKRIRKLNEGLTFPISVILDTRGAEIRTGVVPHPIIIEKNQEVVFSPDPLPDESRTVIIVNYDRFYRDIPETNEIQGYD